MIVPTLVGFIWFSVFGGTALNMQIFQGAQLTYVATKDSSLALFEVLNRLPLSAVTSVVATLLVVIFFVTSGDSATLVLATMSQNGNPAPPNRSKILWGILVSGIALALMMAGGLKAVQTAVIVFALPFALVLSLMALALLRAVRRDWKDEQRQQREWRRKMRTLVQ